MTLTNWIQILFGCIATLGVVFGAGSLWFAHQRHLRETKGGSANRPNVKITINKTYYRDGWRSVQLHVVPSDVQPNFPYQDWRIHRARLVAPRGAVLARAENDDYATRVFFDDNPVREIAGRTQGKPQRFALEFFILFEGEERGQQAKLKVTYGPADESWRATKTFTATVPMDASGPPPSHE